MARYYWSRAQQTFVEYEPGPPPPRMFPAIHGDYAAYRSPLSGKMVEGRYARREEMKRHDVREVDPSERPEGAGIPKSQAQAADERRQLENRPGVVLTEADKRRLLSGK